MASGDRPGERTVFTMRTYLFIDSDGTQGFATQFVVDGQICIHIFSQALECASKNFIELRNTAWQKIEYIPDEQMDMLQDNSDIFRQIVDSLPRD